MNEKIRIVNEYSSSNRSYYILLNYEDKNMMWYKNILFRKI